MKTFLSKIDTFVWGIIVAIIIAYNFPQWGIDESPLPLDIISRWGIALIFFFYGIKMNLKEVKSGLSNWKLHVLIQVVTFLLFPLIVLVFKGIAPPTFEQLWLSFFFLAALPSTVSSSVVMVAIARGNLPAAIFNASISGLIGVLLTPLWIGLFVQQKEAFDYLQVYKQLGLEILLPLFLGLLLQPYLYKFARRRLTSLARFDKLVILLIVYLSFANSFHSGLFQTVSWTTLLTMSIGVVALFFGFYAFVQFMCKLLKFPIPDRITALFCSSKKSLTHGVVFGQAIFGSGSGLGLILLPLMLYHTFQIFIISMYANDFSQRPQKTP